MSIAGDELTQPDSSSSLPSRRKTWIVCGLLLAAGLAVVAALFWPGPAMELPASVSQKEYEEAKRDFIDLFHREPTEVDVMMALAEAAVKNEKLDIAIDCFARIPSEHVRYGTSARLQEAQILLRRNRAEEAEASFRAFLKLAESQPAYPQSHVRLARDWLVFIMAVELRFEDRKAILQQMIQNRQFDAYDAKQYYFPTLLIWQSTLGSSRLGEFLEQTANSRLLLIAKARYLVGEGKLDAANRLLASLREQYPGDAAVIAASLECCYEQVDWNEFERVLNAAPNFEGDEPWLLTQMRAEFANQTQDWATAEKYFRHVLLSDRANPVCHMGLAKALNGQGKTDERKVIQERSLLLARIRVNLSAVDNETAAASRELAADARLLDMTDAAESFEYLAEQIERGVQ